MSEIPVAPSSQKIAVKMLSAATGVRVSTRKPANPPDEFVVISRIGGGNSTFATANPRFLIECFAGDELRAEELAERVRRAWLSLRDSQVIWSSADDNLQRFDDPEHQRFQFTGGLTILLAG